MIRIYIEQNGSLFNYFALKNENINLNRINYVDKKQMRMFSRRKKKKY